MASRVELEVLVGVSQPQILQHNPIVMVEGDKVGWQYYCYIILIIIQESTLSIFRLFCSA